MEWVNEAAEVNTIEVGFDKFVDEVELSREELLA